MRCDLYEYANLRNITRRGMNPTAIPTKAAQAAWPASAGFVRIARTFTSVRVKSCGQRDVRHHALKGYEVLWMAIQKVV